MRLLFIFLMIVFAGVPAALAESFVVQVRGLAPPASAKMATCNENNRPCFLSLSLAAKDGSTDSIDVAVDFAGEEARFEFMRHSVFLPVSNAGETVLTVPLESSEQVFLWDPAHVQESSLLVLRGGRILAQLEVLAFRQKPAD